MAPALLALTALIPRTGEAQSPSPVPAVPGPIGEDPKPTQAHMKTLTSGTYSPGPGYGSLPKRTSHRYLIGHADSGQHSPGDA